MADPHADVKRRHPDIPQDPLPFELPSSSSGEPAKARAKASVRYAKCPRCTKEKPTGVVRADDGSEVFRDHNKVLASGRRIRCNGSGEVAP